MLKRIGIIAAMEEEAREILKLMKEVKQEQFFEKVFYVGTCQSFECILVQCGVGKVNAARTTQLLIDNFQVEAVINVGSAGALNVELDYGDVVISTACIQHDFDITCFHHPKGYITDLGVEIEADKNLVAIFEEATRDVQRVVKGKIATGDQFYNSPEIKQTLREEFKAECDDMEGAAVAQVCFLCQKPFVVIRSISDKPKSKEKVDFYEYLEMASKRCAKIIERGLAIWQDQAF